MTCAATTHVPRRRAPHTRRSKATNEELNVTVRELAAEVGVSDVRINGLLNERFPRSVADRGTRWVLTNAMVAFVRAYYASKATDPHPEAPRARPEVSAEALELPPGDSAAQRGAEGLMIAAAGVALGVELVPGSFDLADGGHVTVDGFSAEPAVIVEAWAHQGQPKPAQRAKVTTDALKLLWIEREVFGSVPTRKVLVLSDDRAAAHFVGGSWVARALRSFQITVLIVELPKDMRKKVVEAQERQGRKFRGK
jgi:hypothetical protein